MFWMMNKIIRSYSMIFLEINLSNCEILFHEPPPPRVIPCTSLSVLDWWKSMKQLLPSKITDGDESVRYSSSEVGRLRGRITTPRLHAEPAGRPC